MQMLYMVLVSRSLRLHSESFFNYSLDPNSYRENGFRLGLYDIAQSLISVAEQKYSIECFSLVNS